MTLDVPGGPFGYLRIWGFDALPEPFINELLRLLPLLPDRGLILDVRGNPGGYIWAAELALQLFTPQEIQPTRFSVLATPFTRRISTIGDLKEEFAPWKASLDAAVRNGEGYAQPIPITDVAACNDIGQWYGGRNGVTIEGSNDRVAPGRGRMSGRHPVSRESNRAPSHSRASFGQLASRLDSWVSARPALT